MKNRTKVFLLFSAIILFFIGCNNKLLLYLLSQLNGQLKIINSTVSKSDFLQKHSNTQNEKNNFKNLELILKFAKLQGFDSDKNYQKIVEPSHPKLIVASASEQYYVKPYLWSFPFLGNVSYKGFFNRNMLYKELDFLKNGNFDIDTGQVNAYSTLGILNDPIMPSMLKLGEAEFAETIFHELVHKYFFESEKQHLNESLAQAFGEELTLKYLKFVYGFGAEKLIKYQHKINARDSLQQFFRNYALELNKFYKSEFFLNSKNKNELKQKMFRQLYLRIYKRGIVSKQKANYLVYKIELSKNAFFSDYIVYFSNKDSLKQVLYAKYNGNFYGMIKGLKNK